MYTFIGDGLQRGLQHGAELSRAIRDRVRDALPSDMPDRDRARLAAPWRDAIEHLDGEILRELDGIARGARVSLDDIVLLNSFEAFQLQEMIEHGGCTAVAVSTRRGAVLVQNWDANSSLARGLGVHRHRDPSSAEVAVLASPGGLGWIGMNEHGLALANNDLLGGPNEIAAPSQAIRRFVLQRSDVLSALSTASSLRHPALRSYLLADSAGRVAGVEALPGEGTSVLPPASSLVHANHAVTERGRSTEDAIAQEAVYPSSRARANRAEELAAAIGAADPLPHLRRLLADHDGEPLSVCRHPSRAERTATAASVVFDCSRRTAEFSFGHACRPHAREAVDFGRDEPTGA